jgi:putative transcriptional regulator
VALRYSLFEAGLQTTDDGKLMDTSDVGREFIVYKFPSVLRRLSSVVRSGFPAVAAIVLSAGVLHAALPSATAPDLSGPTSVAGQLLIATAALSGPPFEHAVILVAQHNKDGALGIVINQPLGQRPIASVLEAFGADASGVSGDVRLFSGGPVDPRIGFVLHSADYRGDNTVDIDGRVALSTGVQILRDIGLGKGPRQSLVAFGYAGWAPSQLDDELHQGVWDVVPEDPALVFDDDRAKVWSDAMARYKPN